LNQTLSYYSKKELQIVVIADTRFPDVSLLMNDISTRLTSAAAYVSGYGSGYNVTQQQKSFSTARDSIP